MKTKTYQTKNVICVLIISFWSFSIIFASPSFCAWKTAGPDGGYINSLAIAPANPDIVYAGTYGLYKSSNAGAFWSKTNLENTIVLDVSVAPDDADTVYTATISGVHKSEDGGDTWSEIGLSGLTVNTIAISPANSAVILAGTGIIGMSGDTAGIYMSTNGGDTWQVKLSNGLDSVADIIFDADNPQYIYAAVYDDGGGPGLRKSTNGGDDWVNKWVGDNWLWDNVFALAMTPPGTDTPAIYAVNASAGDVYKSTDQGESWSPTGAPSIAGVPPWSLAVDPNNPDLIYAASNYHQGRFYKSDDGGDNWSIKANGLPPSVPSSILVDPRDSSVYAGLDEGGIYKSADAAESWVYSSIGISNCYILNLAVDPFNSKKVFAVPFGTGQHIAKTTNGGVSWTHLQNSPTDRAAIAIDPGNTNIIYAGIARDLRTNLAFSLNKSTDSGQSWTTTNIIFYIQGSFRVGFSDIWIKPDDSNTILAATAGYANEGGGIYRSINGGSSWDRAYNFWANTLASDPTDSEKIYFGSSYRGYVFQSLDAGETWTNISHNAPNEWVDLVRDIEVDLESNVYAATDAGLMKWNGSVWTKLAGLPGDDINAVAIDISVNPGILYVAVWRQGVFVSKDSGLSWESFNKGLPSFYITKLAVSKFEPKILYAGTAYEGVWGRALTNTVLPWILLLLFGSGL